MNDTARHITVGTTFTCNIRFYEDHGHLSNPTWRHNMIGCSIIQILQNMYNFSISYVVESSPMGKTNSTIDVYANPMSMAPEILDFAKPVHTVLLWRFGFILRRPHDITIYLKYYSKPFSRPVWNCLYSVAFIVALMFYLLSWLEKRLLRSQLDCSLGIEILLAIGGHCQHIFPVEAILNSRRTAYFVFFLYTYIIYTYYTSNLLSHLVSDKEDEVYLEVLSTSDYDIIVLETMEDVYYNNYTCFDCINSNMTNLISAKLKRAKFVNIGRAIKDLRTKKTALLSDYISVYPHLKRAFNNEEICQLKEIDLSTQVRKYLFSSKRFRFREQLVIGTLRAKEAGVLHRLTWYDAYQPLACQVVAHRDVELAQIFTPLMILIGAYFCATCVMLVERWLHRRNTLWPYVE